MPIFVTLIYTVNILSNINDVTVKPISCTEKSFVLKHDFFYVQKYSTHPVFRPVEITSTPERGACISILKN